MILSGKEPAEKIQAAVAMRMNNLPRPPSLSVILVGDDAPSMTYVETKKRVCQSLGIKSEVHYLSKDTTENTLLEKIRKLNLDPSVDGILVQLPLPAHLNSDRIISALDPKKDVDGFHPINMGKLLLGQTDGFIPCTPLGIYEMLKYYEIPTEGAHVVILGRSIVVGKPLAALLMQNRAGCNATVTVAHRHTKELSRLTQTADILVVAVGSPKTVTADMIKPNAVVIDVGINRLQDPKDPKCYHIEGDVDFERVREKCRAITPVPKGVGPMTIAMLVHNTTTSAERRLL